MILKYIIEVFIPTFSTNLLAFFIALSGGFYSTVIFMGIPKLFSWIGPLIPNIPWSLESFIIIVMSLFGFMFINIPLRLSVLKKGNNKYTKIKNNDNNIIYISIIFSIMMLLTTGLLGIKPSIIASGSMKPNLNVGDVVIVLNNPVENIKVGNVVVYKSSSIEIAHRVIDIINYEKSSTIITKGDANKFPDDPIIASGTIGKVIYTIPKIGWISIYIKNSFISMINIMNKNRIIMYILIISSILTSSSYAIIRYKKRPKFHSIFKVRRNKT